MGIIIYALIYAGSALMVYNIVRCYGFVKRMRAMNGMEDLRFVLPIPLILLIGFLIGYLAVALFGEPDLVIAGILSGGSLFVAIVLGVMYRIIGRLGESNKRLDALYAGMKDDLAGLAENYLSLFRVNVTKDYIEEGTAKGLYEHDLKTKSYSEMMSGRSGHLKSATDYSSGDYGLFTREGLLNSYKAGKTAVQERLFVELDSGERYFVQLRATLTEQPDTGDVVAFITEEICNDDMVNEVLLGRALGEEFDMITSLIGGRYEVVIGSSAENRKGSIFPKTRSGSYRTYLEQQVAPAICGMPEVRGALLDSLRFETVERVLAERDSYEVNISVSDGGEVFYKRFVFYVVDRAAKFFLLMKSDTTEARREEIQRNERLQAALEEAQLASKSKTTFLSNMSHDIRTPMNAIVGYTDFARKCDDMGKIHEYLEKIDSSNKYMLALINDVLEMSRIESGKLDLFPEEVDLPAVVYEVRDMFETQMKDKGITYTVDTSLVRDARVLCDKTRFNRVLLNLVSNAYKFTPKGGSVDVRLAEIGEVVDGRALYELRVKDTGIGMSAEFAEKVFDAFERERNTTASGIQGTGLGMAITKRIVDMMGGSVELITAQGEGSEFIVTIPFEVCAGAIESAGTDVKEPGDIDFGGMRVLLAEDNEINREIACMVLEEMGFAVDTAVNGKEAVELLSASKPGFYSVVVTDIQMPVMDGYEEARAIRALGDPALAGIPIVAMSANAFREDVQASKEAGMNGHIAKPVNVDEMVAILAEVLADSKR